MARRRRKPKPRDRGEADDARRRRRFALSFCSIATLLFVAYCFPYAENGIGEGGFHGYLDGYARVAGAVLSFFDPSLAVTGADLTGRASLRIVKSCDAMEANILFAAAILAFPAAGQRRRKVVALVLGLAALLVANLIRIASLYLVKVYRPDWFETLHLDVWPLAMILIATGQFVAWARFLTPGERRASPSSAAPPLGHAEASARGLAGC